MPSTLSECSEGLQQELALREKSRCSYRRARWGDSMRQGINVPRLCPRPPPFPLFSQILLPLLPLFLLPLGPQLLLFLLMAIPVLACVFSEVTGGRREARTCLWNSKLSTGSLPLDSYPQVVIHRWNIFPRGGTWHVVLAVGVVVVAKPYGGKV